MVPERHRKKNTRYWNLGTLAPQPHLAAWPGRQKWYWIFVSEKKFTQQLRQNRWEPVQLLVSVSSSQQMKLVDSGALSWLVQLFFFFFPPRSQAWSSPLQAPSPQSWWFWSLSETQAETVPEKKNKMLLKGFLVQPPSQGMEKRKLLASGKKKIESTENNKVTCNPHAWLVSLWINPAQGLSYSRPSSNLQQPFLGIK